MSERLPHLAHPPSWADDAVLAAVTTKPKRRTQDIAPVDIPTLPRQREVAQQGA